MSNVPEDLRYTAEHEWAKDEGGGVISIGITDYAQDALGDITYIELPEIGVALDGHATFGVVESVKTFSDLYAPLAGEVVEVNVALVDDPEQINGDAYGSWLIKIRLADDGELASLMDAAAYAKHLEDAG